MLFARGIPRRSNRWRNRALSRTLVLSIVAGLGVGAYMNKDYLTEQLRTGGNAALVGLGDLLRSGIDYLTSPDPNREKFDDPEDSKGELPATESPLEIAVGESPFIRGDSFDTNHEKVKIKLAQAPRIPESTRRPIIRSPTPVSRVVPPTAPPPVYVAPTLTSIPTPSPIPSPPTVVPTPTVVPSPTLTPTPTPTTLPAPSLGYVTPQPSPIPTIVSLPSPTRAPLIPSPKPTPTPTPTTTRQPKPEPRTPRSSLFSSPIHYQSPIAGIKLSDLLDAVPPVGNYGAPRRDLDYDDLTHLGIDLPANLGDTVYAIAKGKVVHVGNVSIPRKATNYLGTLKKLYSYL